MATATGWRARQSDRYPFDTKDVWLRMLPVDFDGDAVLVPDLEAYPVINPSQLPGLESDIVLAGWDTLQSYFRYRQNSYSTNFGIREYVGRTGFPELYYTVDLRRDFGNAFVSDIIPLLVVACLLFGVLATATTLLVVLQWFLVVWRAGQMRTP
jgi:hypothetical protein